MPDRVDQRAAELATEAKTAKAAKDASDARCSATLADFESKLAAGLAEQTRHKVKVKTDRKECVLKISYAKRQFESTVERDVLELRLNRFELDRGGDRVFQLRIPFDALLPTWMTPPADDVAVREALRMSVEIVLESMAKSVANGCTIVSPD